MPETIVGFNPEDAGKLVEIIDEHDAQPSRKGFAPSRRRTPITRPTEYVRVTSTSTNTEIGVAAYPGVRVEHNARANTWSDKDSVYVLFANGVAPTSTSTRFHARATGVNPSNDRLIYAAYDVSASTAFSGARTSKTFAQSIPDTTETVLDISTSTLEYDTDSYRDGDKFTLPTQAYYRFGAYVSFTANATGIRHLRISSSGGAGLCMSLVPTAGSGFPTRLCVSDEAVLGAVGSTWIKAYVQQTSGGNLDCIAWGFWISRIG